MSSEGDILAGMTSKTIHHRPPPQRNTFEMLVRMMAVRRKQIGMSCARFDQLAEFKPGTVKAIEEGCRGIDKMALARMLSVLGLELALYTGGERNPLEMLELQERSFAIRNAKGGRARAAQAGKEELRAMGRKGGLERWRRWREAKAEMDKAR